MVDFVTINAGSSSVRLSVFATRADALVEVRSLRRPAGQQPGLLEELLEERSSARVAAAVHRVVHGGDAFVQPVVIDAQVEAEIARLSELAPLHNPAALAWIRAARRHFGPAVPQVAVFDTAFFAALPQVAREYALPGALAREHGVRRYGFHGLAHQWMWRRWRALAPDVAEGGRAISFQLGSGCSASAMEGGAPRETSMGFSALEGLVMATRSGDIDPLAATFLQRRAALAPEALEELLGERSGLLGMAGEADMARLLAREDEAARLAIALYCHRARKYLGAYLAVLGGADAILFGGGVGENAPEIRARILQGMEWAGIALEAQANRTAAGEACISAPRAPTRVWVIPVNEAALMVEEARRLLFPS
jgi:acetate kinase